MANVQTFNILFSFLSEITFLLKALYINLRKVKSCVFFSKTNIYILYCKFTLVFYFAVLKDFFKNSVMRDFKNLSDCN